MEIYPVRFGEVGGVREFFSPLCNKPGLKTFYCCHNLKFDIMRKNIAFGMIMFAAVLMAGCGKEPEKVYGITVSYPELTASETLSVIRTERNNPAVVTDTAFRVVLDEYNSYTAFVGFQDESHDIVLVVGGGMYRDTVSGIEIIRDKKKNGSDVRYLWNGGGV